MAVGENGSGPVLHLTLLGDFASHADGRAIVIPSRKSRALLSYLALSPGMRASRERLCGVLWRDSPTELAQGSLRHEVWTIRQALKQAGCPVLVPSRLDLQLDSARVRVDVNDLVESWLGTGRIAPELLSRTRIADDLGYGYEDLLSDWLLVRRQQLHNDMLHSLEQMLAEPAGARCSVRDVCRALLNLDPTHEVACRDLMRSLAEMGNRAGALQVYSRLWRELDEEHGEEPSATTQAVYLEIKTGASAVAERAASPGALPEPDAVPERQAQAAKGGPEDLALVTIHLPLPEMESLRPDEQRLVRGLRMDLLACLARFREWRIIAGPPADVAGRSGYVLRMDAGNLGEDLALAMTLSEVGSELVVWGDSLNISVKGWSETQREIVRRLSMALNIYISADRLARVRQGQDFELEIYDRWLRGQELFLSYQGANWARAEELFRSVAAEAPSFSRAHSSLAQLENSRHLAFPGIRRSPKTLERALAHSERAVSLDPMDSRAQLCRAWSLAMGGRYGRAELGFDTACELNPSDPWTLVSAALGMAFADRPERAAALARHAQSAGLVQKPVYAGYIATLNFLCGDYQGCISAVDEAGGAIHNLPGWKAAALGLLGRTEAAARVARAFVERTRTSWHAEEEPTPSAVADWFLQCFPIRNCERWQCLRRGLSEAGLEVSHACPPVFELDDAAQPHWPVV